MLQYELPVSGNTVFVVGRSPNPNGPFSLIATNPVSAPWSYWDDSVSPGQTNYYVVALDFTDGFSGLTYQSAYSNTNGVTAQPDLIAPNSLWYMTDWNELAPANIDTNQPVLTINTNLIQPVFTNWVAGPFGHAIGYPAERNSRFPGLPPLPPITINTNPVWAWTNSHTILAHTVLNLTGYTSQQLSNVVYSTAIDNSYMLFINRTNVNENPGQVYSGTWASWGKQSQNQQLFSPLPNLVAGTNTVDVVFWGDGDNMDYFSIIVNTNTCHRGWLATIFRFMSPALRCRALPAGRCQPSFFRVITEQVFVETSLVNRYFSRRGRLVACK
jgi:hypothetical protein